MLLMYQYQHGSVPTKRRLLEQISGLTADEFDDFWIFAESKFERDGYGLAMQNPRMTKELAEQEAAYAKYVAAARASHEKRRENKETEDNENSDAICDAICDAQCDALAPQSLILSSLSSCESKSLSKKSPSWVFPEGWESAELIESLDRWQKVRKRKTPKDSTSRIFPKFDDAAHLLRAVVFCEANGYQGLKPEYETKSTQGNRPVTFAQQKMTNIMDGARQFIEEMDAKEKTIEGRVSDDVPRIR